LKHCDKNHKTTKTIPMKNLNTLCSKTALMAAATALTLGLNSVGLLAQSSGKGKPGGGGDDTPPVRITFADGGSLQSDDGSPYSHDPSLAADSLACIRVDSRLFR
jgi:hypothetical protein